MMQLHAPMETLVMVNCPGPGKVATYEMNDTCTAERVKEMSNPDNPSITYAH